MTRLTWLLLLAPCLLEAQQTGPYTTVTTTKVGDTVTTRWGHGTTDSVLTVKPKPPIPQADSTPQPPVSTKGIPFGCSGCLNADVPVPVTMSLDGYDNTTILAGIAKGRATGFKLMLNILGGAHGNYVTAGKWDVAKAQTRLNTLNTPAIRAAIAAGVADGTIIGASVMDEPFQETASRNQEKSWGPHGWMNKAKVDDLCGRAKAIFPTLPVGVVHDASDFYPTVKYRVCGFLAAQYRTSKGTAAAFLAENKAFTDASGMALVTMLNYLHGGPPSTTCPKYGTDNPSGTLCPMLASQIKTVGLLFGSVSCAVGGWRYEYEYMDRPDIRDAFKFVSDSLRKLPAKPCRRAP